MLAPGAARFFSGVPHPHLLGEPHRVFMTILERLSPLLDWLDRRKAWQFVAILYAARWVALAPVMIGSRYVFTQDQNAAASVPPQWREGTTLGLFLSLVLISPILETLLECSLPYWIIANVRDYRSNRPNHCWGFVAISACLMAALHPMLAALLPAFITGAFLAYCYVHFASGGTWRATAATAIFHGGINIVGWTMLILG